MQIISYTKGTITLGSPQFNGRVGFMKSMPSNDVSLYINNTKESDSGSYACQILLPGISGLTSELKLDVNGKKLIQPEDSEDTYTYLHCCCNYTEREHYVG